MSLRAVVQRELGCLSVVLVTPPPVLCGIVKCWLNVQRGSCWAREGAGAVPPGVTAFASRRRLRGSLDLGCKVERRWHLCTELLPHGGVAGIVEADEEPV